MPAQSKRLVTCSVADAVETSAPSTSSNVTDPLSVTYEPVSTAPVFGLSATVAVSSVTAPVTSTTVITGVSLVPLIVTVRVALSKSPSASFSV